MRVYPGSPQIETQIVGLQEVAYEDNLITLCCKSDQKAQEILPELTKLPSTDFPVSRILTKKNKITIHFTPPFFFTPKTLLDRFAVYLPTQDTSYKISLEKRSNGHLKPTCVIL